MKLESSTRSLQLTKAQHFEQQVNEILSLIISEVRCQSIQDLVSLCLVSRQFYVLALPHLYRKIALDLGRASHFRLFRRLGRPGSHVPGMIRHLHVYLEEKHAEHRHRIKKVFDGLINLEELEWKGPLNVPVSILDALYTRFRRARLSIKSRGAMYKSIEIDAPLLWDIDLWIAHPAASMINHLCLTLDEDSRLWIGFRKDLVHMVIRNPALVSLQIIASDIPDNHCTSMVDIMEGHVLPKLQELRLFVGNTPIFTQDELLLWSLQGGWECLTFLGLYHIQSFIPFVGRTPKLEELWLLPRDEEDTEDLESHLAEWEGSSPFPALRRLKTRSPWSDFTPTQHTHRVVPWYMLNSLPLGQLKFLDISRPYESEHDITDAPQAEDVAKIRVTCPDLDELRLNMILPWSREPWPSNTFRELAAFTKSIKLTVFLHNSRQPDTANKPLFLARCLRWLFRSSFKIGRCLRKERESQRMASKPPFSVDLIWTDDILTEIDEVIKSKQPSYGIKIHEGVSGTCSNLVLNSRHDHNKDLDWMSLEDLKGKTKPRFKNVLGGRARYSREIKRHKKLDRVGPGGYEIDVTLYDILTQSEFNGRESWR